MKRYVVHLEDSQIVRLHKIASQGRIRVAEHIRRAIDEYIEKMEREAKKANKKTDGTAPGPELATGAGQVE